MRVLLTGGSGQVGTAVKRAAPAGLELVSPSSKELDIGEPNVVEAALARIRPDIVVNAAAYTAVDRAEEEAEQAWAVNAAGAESIARACSANGTYLVQLSTDYVFDGTKTSPYVESDPTNPLGVYGRSKCAGESAALTECRNTLVLRLGWVFSDTGQNFVKTILRLARERGALSVVDDQWGTPTSAKSIAAVILLAIRRFQSGDPLFGIYHFASRPSTNWFQFACEIVACARRLGALEREVPVTAIDSRTFGARAPRPSHSVLDPTRLCQALEIESPDWRQDVRSTIDRLVSTSVDG